MKRRDLLKAAIALPAARLLPSLPGPEGVVLTAIAHPEVSDVPAPEDLSEESIERIIMEFNKGFMWIRPEIAAEHGLKIMGYSTLGMVLVKRPAIG